MLRKLISDLSRLLRAMLVTYLIFSNFYEKSRRDIRIGFFFLILFVLKFHLKLVALKKRLFFPIFLSNISFWILKLFVFHAVAIFLGTKLVEERPSGRLIYSAPVGKFTRAGLTFGKLSPQQQRRLTKSNTINSCSIGNASNMLSLTAILVVI